MSELEINYNDEGVERLKEYLKAHSSLWPATSGHACDVAMGIIEELREENERLYALLTVPEHLVTRAQVSEIRAWAQDKLNELRKAGDER